MQHQVWEMYEALSCVNDYTGIPHKVQTYDLPCQFHRYNEMFSKGVTSNVKFKCDCCRRFF